MSDVPALRYLVDNEFRQKMQKALEPIAALLLERDLWRTHWDVQIDGCVFKMTVKGYPKFGSPRYLKREAELRETMKEFDHDAG